MTGQAHEWAAAPFTERDFYLADFRERTLAVAGTPAALANAGPLRSVLEELARNRTRIVLLTPDVASARAQSSIPAR